MGRGANEILADIDEVATLAAEIVARGKRAWDTDQMLRLAGEAIIGRIADAAGRLPEAIRSQVPDVPWDDIRDIRILVDHIYHRIDYAILWRSLRDDIPHLQARLAETRGGSNH